MLQSGHRAGPGFRPGLPPGWPTVTSFSPNSWDIGRASSCPRPGPPRAGPWPLTIRSPRRMPRAPMSRNRNGTFQPRKRITGGPSSSTRITRAGALLGPASPIGRDGPNGREPEGSETGPRVDPLSLILDAVQALLLLQLQGDRSGHRAGPQGGRARSALRLEPLYARRVLPGPRGPFKEAVAELERAREDLGSGSHPGLGDLGLALRPLGRNRRRPARCCPSSRST